MSNSEKIICAYRDVCSGCVLFENVNQPPLYKEVADFFQEKQIPFVYHSQKANAWRSRAKLAVRGTKENPFIGLYKANSHDVIDIPDCAVHYPQINQATKAIKEWIKQCQIEPYEEKSKTGLLRYIQCVVERNTGLVQLTLVMNDSSASKCVYPIETLWSQAPNLWHSIWINYNQSVTNTIFGSDWQLIKGQEFVVEKILDTTICFHPANFAQANLAVFEELLKSLRELTPNQNIVEYYAGVGVIGLSLSSFAKTVICSEINGFAEKSFRESATYLKNPNVSFKTGAAQELEDLLDEADVVIVDPPRKGLDKGLLQALLKKNPAKELWYVSCGFSSFKKDCEALEAHWTLNKAAAYLFFPGTNQLEILAKFERK